VVTIDLPEHQPKAAIVLQLASGDTLGQTLVSNSRSIEESSTAFEYPADAVVSLLKDGQPFADFTLNVNAARYEADFEDDGFPTTNPAKYSLEVEHPDFGTYTIDQRMPAPAAISNPIFEAEGAITPDGFREDEFTFTVTDTDPSQRNYYGIRLFYVQEFVDPLTNDTLRFENQLGLCLLYTSPSPRD